MPPPSTQSADSLAPYAELLAQGQAVRGTSLGRDAWRRLRRNRTAMFSLVYLVVICLLAALTPLWPLQSPRTVNTDRLFAPPEILQFNQGTFVLSDDPDDPDNAENRDREIRQMFGELNFFDRLLVEARARIFGTWTMSSICGADALGRDMLSRLFWGARVSLMVGLVATLVSLVIGVSYGAISGYLGGRVDEVMMRMVDVLYSIPFIFIVIFLITVLSAPKIKADLESWGIDRIKVFYVVVGAIYWLTMARVVRGQVLSLKNEQFVDAARTTGAGQARIIFRHLVPNLFSVIIVYLTLTIPSVMLFEAFLSFLGLGVEAPDVSWGVLANEGLQVISPIKTYWWLVVFPSLALGMTLFALNFLGDGLRDALDPRMKNRA